MVVVDHYNISRLVNLHDSFGKSLVQAIVVRPGLSHFLAICGLILLVVKEIVQFMLGIATPFVLVFKCRDVAILVELIQQPNGDDLASGVVAKSFVEAESVSFCDTYAFMIASFMVVGGTADRDRGRSPTDWSKLDWKEVSLGGHLVDGRLLANFSRPSNKSVLPLGFVAGKISERVEEGRCTTSRAQIPRNGSATSVDDGVGHTKGSADYAARQVQGGVFGLWIAVCLEIRPG